MLLLFSILFNIVHIGYINLTSAHTCKHQNTITQKLKIPQDNCGDLCDMHHICCFHAIMPLHILVFESTFYSVKIALKNDYYTPPFQKTLTKPPIC